MGQQSRTGGGPTIGVEEEFLVVDPAEGIPVPRAAEVIASVHRRALLGGTVVKPELQRSQVEVATGVCGSLADLRAQLGAARTALADAARRLGVLVVAVGHPVLTGPAPGLAAGERFGRIARTYGRLIEGYQACGCHVHVGVPDRGTAVAVLDRIRPWLPTLLAVSANSVFDRGTDTGYQSWRIAVQSRFPGAGIGPRFGSVREYDRRLDRLVAAGVLVDRQMTFWFARPSEHLPTVEVRIADVAGTVDEAVLQAALTRALVRRALADLAADRPAPEVCDEVLPAATWAAARYGLDGPGVDPWRGRQVPATRLLGRLLDQLGPYLEPAGRRLVGQLLVNGNGAYRQRRSAGGPLDVIRRLAVRGRCFPGRRTG